VTPQDPTFRWIGDACVVGCVVGLADDLDIAVAGPVEAVIVERLEAGVPLVVDLTEVSFLDSAGVRLLDRLVGRQNRAGAAVRIVAPDGGSPRFTLDLSGFPADLLAGSVDDAVAGIGSPHGTATG
jgi:anti-anti-sigma factor